MRSGSALLACALVAIAVGVGCGGNVSVPAPSAGGAAGHSGSAGGGASGGGSSGVSGGGSSNDAGFDAYVDPGCPDASDRPLMQECDPFAVSSGCPEGQGCYPYVSHPAGSGCGTQGFGTICVTAGPGQQGDPCQGGAEDCASGFVCVVGAAPGKRCAQLCPLDGSQSCPHGLICGELDVAGYGVCS